jgi:DNA-binding CsgD family transcriptional regulator
MISCSENRINYLYTVNESGYLAFAKYHPGRVYRNDTALNLYLSAEKSNYEKAFNHYNIQETERKYRNEERLNETYKSIIRYIVSGMLVSGIILVLFLYHKKKRYKTIKQEEEEKTVKMKTGLNRQIDELQAKLLDVESKKSLFYSLIHRNIKKIVLFDCCRDFAKNNIDRQTFIATINSLNFQKEKNNIYEDINILYDNILDKTKIQYPDLKEQELKIICLICADFDNSDIAVALTLDKHTVERKKSNIRKKMGIKGDIKVFILKNVR